MGRSLLFILPLLLLPALLSSNKGRDAVVDAAQMGGILLDNRPSGLVIPRLRYAGGGDWYNAPSSEINLLRFAATETGIDVDPRFEPMTIDNDRLFDYPLLFLTGHGNVRFSDAELVRLRAYLDNGGFLYVDDDYGLDTAIRREIARLFPDRTLFELPFSHGIYRSFADFSANGLPKIHEHDGKDPQGFGLHDRNGRLCLFYTYETNLADGWADSSIHGDPPEKREAALRFGANIVVWVMTQ